MRALGFLAALAALGMHIGSALGAAPSPFTEYANAALFDIPQVTPDPMDLNMPMQCIDANGNGRDEIISGGPIDSIWRVMEQDASGRFDVRAAARRPFPTISSFGASQGRALLIDSSGGPGQAKLYAQIVDDLEFTGRYDLRTGELEAVAYLMGKPMAIRDFNGDGVGELVVFQDTSSAGVSWVHIYDAQMSRLLASFQLTTGVVQAIALGNFDDDPQWEIASSAGIVYELTLDALREDGTFAERMEGDWIAYMSAADVDADGKDEIVVAYWTLVAVIDHEQRAVKWSGRPAVNSTAQLNVLKTIDLLGNSTPEVVIGQVGHPAAPGNFVIFDGATGTELRTIEHPDTSVFGLNACDVDGDGNRDLIAGLVRPVTGPNRLYVYDPVTGQLKWRSVSELGMLRAATIADADGDGQQEIVVAPYELYGTGDLRLHSYDLGTLAHRWTTDSPMLPPFSTGSLNTLAAGDADGDGDVDLVVGSDNNGGRIWIVDGRTRALVRSIQVGDPGSQVRAVALTNVAGDSSLEIVAASSNGRVYAIRGSDGTVAWQAGWGTKEAKGMQIADFDVDGTSDVLLHVVPEIPGTGMTELFVVNGASHAVRSLNTDCASSILALNVAGTSTPEVVVGGCEGNVEVIDVASTSVLQSRHVCDTPINAIARNDLSTAGANEILFTCHERVGWLSLSTGESKLITAIVGDQIGVGNNLFSGHAAGSDFITVTTTEGVAQLRPTASLAPYVWPYNPTTTNIYRVDNNGGRVTDTIGFGSFDGLPATLEVVQQPRHGRLTVTSAQAGEFRYESTDSYVGFDLLVVRARTALSVSPPTSIPIHIRASSSTNPPAPGNPDPPTSPPSNGNGGGGGGMSVTLLLLLALLPWLRPRRNSRRESCVPY